MKLFKNKNMKLLKKKNGGFPESSVGEEFACSVGDPGLIPGRVRKILWKREWLLHSSASLVAQLVKNPPTMQEAWV